MILNLIIPQELLRAEGDEVEVEQVVEDVEALSDEVQKT